MSSTPSLRSLILDHQLSAFDRLVAIGNACISIHRETLPFRPRTNTLITGPSGAGKTFLGRIVAKELGASFLPLSITDWIILGCTQRGAENSWITILKFLLLSANNPLGAVIFLDEIDKLTGQTSWDIHLRVEAFQLLDLSMPIHLTDDDGNALDPGVFAVAQEVLTTRTFIIGAGAFQHLWESRAQGSLGFGSQPIEADLPGPNDLAKTLPRELVNRFRREILILPPLHNADYFRMLERAATAMPDYLRETFLKIGKEKMPEAVDMQQGCRYLEEVLLDTIVAERALLREIPKPTGNSGDPKRTDLNF